MTSTLGDGTGYAQAGAGGAAAPNVPGLAQETPGMTPQQAEDQAMQEYQSNPALQQYIQDTYAYTGWVLNNPEVLRVVVAAAINQWDGGRFNGALEQTQWWQTNGSSVRNWNQLQATDPASAQAQIAQQKADILTKAQAMGVNLTDSALTGLATQSAMFSWDGNQIQQALQGSYTAPGSTAGATGDAATIEQTIRNVGGQYLTPMSDNAVTWWTTTAMKMGQSASQVQSEMANMLGQQAQQRFPWMKQAIDSGMTPQQYLDPYTQQAAKTLSIAPDSIDWTDPKWTGALLQTNPDGTQTPVNSDQFNKALMQNASFGYSKTQGAIDQAATTAKTIEQTFGAIKL